ncbi:MAG: hypothetical protein ACREQV_03450 [Candidatus Binatia bacterium]
MKRLVIAFALVAIPLLGQDHPNIQRGILATSTTQSNGPDHVNLFNGNVTIPITVGPRYQVNAFSYQISLAYSTNIWDFAERWGGCPEFS